MTPTKNAHTCVEVDLGGRSYPIHIGADLLPQAHDLIGRHIKDRHVVIIADKAFNHSHHLDAFRQSLRPAAARINKIGVSGGEGSKSITSFRRVTSSILDLGIDRQTILVAFGGGVIGDLVGFIAATLLRGLDFIQVPTTLLAQVDSAVGGKTGINAKAGKNLIGAFHQPLAVLADSDTLKTLPLRELRAGYAEVVKYGLLGDAGFFAWLEENSESILTIDEKAMRRCIETCCRAKARIVAKDEYEAGRRAVLNLGHTFGHAYEAEAGYDGSVLHGEAIAVGMVDAYRLGLRLGTVSPQDLSRVKAHLHHANLPTKRSRLSNKLEQADPQRLIKHMLKDKKAALKNTDASLVFIVPHGIGAAHINTSIATEDILALLTESCP